MAVSPAQNLQERSPPESPVAPESGSPELESSEGLLALMSAGGAGNRREAQRHSFPAVQRVAPCRGTTKPLETDFQLIWCHDLSTSGISFHWSTTPNFDQVVVALASPKGTIRLLARVMFYRPHTEQLGRYLICCRFVRRLPN